MAQLRTQQEQSADTQGPSQGATQADAKDEFSSLMETIAAEERAREGDADDDDGDEGEGATGEGTDAEGDATDGKTPKGGDDAKTREEAAKAAEREALIEEGRRLEREAKSEAARTEHKDRTIEEIRDAFPQTVRDARAKLEASNTPTAVINEVLNLLEKYNLGSLEGNEKIINRALFDKFKQLVPEGDYDAFEKANTGKPAEAWVQDVAERIALKTAAFTGLETVDDLLKVASPKLKADILAREAKAEKDGRAKGQTDIGGEPEGGSGGTYTPAKGPITDKDGKIDVAASLAQIERTPPRRRR